MLDDGYGSLKFEQACRIVEKIKVGIDIYKTIAPLAAAKRKIADIGRESEVEVGTISGHGEVGKLGIRCKEFSDSHRTHLPNTYVPVASK